MYNTHNSHKLFVLQATIRRQVRRNSVKELCSVDDVNRGTGTLDFFVFNILPFASNTQYTTQNRHTKCRANLVHDILLFSSKVFDFNALHFTTTKTPPRFPNGIRPRIVFADSK